MLIRFNRTCDKLIRYTIKKQVLQTKQHAAGKSNQCGAHGYTHALSHTLHQGFDIRDGQAVQPGYGTQHHNKTDYRTQ